MLNWRCSRIFTVKEEAREEFIEKKSRFIATIFPINSKEEAENIIQRVKKEFWDAKHNVYAYILPNNISKYSDDGEPQGTAGLPVFTVLNKKELVNVLVVVTRYFGGVLLGKGGLIRAYSESVKNVLEKAKIYEIIEKTCIEIECEYSIKDKILDYITKHEIQHTSVFENNVKFKIETPKGSEKKIIEDIVQITNNKANYRILSE